MDPARHKVTPEHNGSEGARRFGGHRAHTASHTRRLLIPPLATVKQPFLPPYVPFRASPFGLTQVDKPTNPRPTSSPYSWGRKTSYAPPNNVLTLPAFTNPPPKYIPSNRLIKNQSGACVMDIVPLAKRDRTLLTYGLF